MLAANKPVIVCAGNGYEYLERAYEHLKNGGDTLDAAIQVVKGPEDDPNDDSVGLGGLPDEEGVVELHASCMHGPTRRAGSAGGVRNIRTMAELAREVMNHSGHVMLVGEGAERFAVARGMKRENLLTDETRKVWLLWKEAHSDWWGPGVSSPNWRDRFKNRSVDERLELHERLQRIAEDLGIDPAVRSAAIHKIVFPPTGTIHCSALAANGDMSGCTTTSGLPGSFPGRFG
jgi:N4-(beta-N-acetylglucosaminyl)-L-asparaginase